MFDMSKIVKPYLPNSSGSSFTCNSLDLTLATSLVMILKICLIMAQTCAARAEVWACFSGMKDSAICRRAVHMATRLAKGVGS